ncbi:hypothetical protein JCM10213v2_003818 [Rhodosporidiobolus nylandii]
MARNDPGTSGTPTERRTSTRVRQPTRKTRSTSSTPPLKPAQKKPAAPKTRSATSKRARKGPPKATLAAQVLGAVFTLTKRRKASEKGVGHAAVKSHLLGHGRDDGENEKSFVAQVLKIKHDLAHQGVLTKGESTGITIAVAEDAREEMQELKERKTADTDDDEDAAAAYLAQSRKSTVSKSTAKKKRVVSRDYSSSEEEAAPSTSRKRKAPAPKKKTPRKVPAKQTGKQVQPDEGDEEETDQLASSEESAEEAAPKKRKKTAPGPQGGLTRMRKDDLVALVKELRAKTATLEKGKGKAAVEEDSELSEVDELEDEGAPPKEDPRVKALAERAQKWEAKAKAAWTGLAELGHPTADEEWDGAGMHGGGGEQEEYGGGMDQQADFDFLNDYVAHPFDPTREDAFSQQEQAEPHATSSGAQQPFSLVIPTRSFRGSASGDGGAQQQQPRASGFGSPSFPELDVDAGEVIGGATTSQAGGVPARNSSFVTAQSGLPSPARSVGGEEPSSPLARGAVSRAAAEKGGARDSTSFAFATPGPSSSSPAKSLPATTQEAQTDGPSSRIASTEPSSPVAAGAGSYFARQQQQAISQELEAERQKREQAERRVAELLRQKEDKDRVEKVMKEELDLVARRAQDTQEELREVQAKLDESEATYEALLASDKETQEARSEALREVERLKAYKDLAAAREDLDLKTKELAALQAVEKEVTAQRDATAARYEVVKRQRDEEAAKREETDRFLSAEREKTQADQQTITALNAEIAEFRSQLEDLEPLRKQAEEAEELKGRVGVLTGDLSETKRRLAEATSAADTLKNTEAALRVQLGELTVSAETAQAKIISLEDANEEAMTENKTLAEELARESSANSALTSQILDLAASCGISPSPLDFPTPLAQATFVLPELSSRLRTLSDTAARYASSLAEKDRLVVNAADVAVSLLDTLPSSDSDGPLSDDEKTLLPLVLERLSKRILAFREGVDSTAAQRDAALKALSDLGNTVRECAEAAGVKDVPSGDVAGLAQKMKELAVARASKCEKAEEDKKKAEDEKQRSEASLQQEQDEGGRRRNEQQQVLAEKDRTIASLRASNTALSASNAELAAKVKETKRRVRRISEFVQSEVDVGEGAEDASVAGEA